MAGYNLFDDIFSFFDTAISKELDDYSSNFPPVDIYVENEDEDIVFELATAGYSPDALDISFSGDSFRIQHKSAEDVSENKEKRKYLKKRIAKRDFSLKYSLAPGKFDTEKAEASYKNGILKIKIPRNKASKPRLLSIKVEK